MLVVGHKNPDNDSIASAVAYAHLKNELNRREVAEGKQVEALTYKPVCLGPLPQESAWVLEQNGIEAPELIDHVEAGQKVALV
ncbi:MAG: DHH family phosphoesterase, partial [Eggerthellaceae bacterium]